MTLSATRAKPRIKLWMPRQVQVTAAAAEQPHTAEILARLERAGVHDIELLRSDRREVLREWYPRTQLEMDETVRTRLYWS